MTKNRFIVYALLLVIVALLLSLAVMMIRARAADAALDKYIEVDLRHQGYKPGRYTKPVIVDAPTGSKPLVHAEGGVRYAPLTVVTFGGAAPLDDRATPPKEKPGSAVPEGGPISKPVTTPLCSLDALDVTVTCVLDVIQGPRRPFGRLVVGGIIEGHGQRRVLQPLPAGDVKLQVAKSAAPQNWSLDLLSGLSAGRRVGGELGLAWAGRSRWGGYALAEWQPSTGLDPADWRVHGGAKITLK